MKTNPGMKPFFRFPGVPWFLWICWCIVLLPNFFPLSWWWGEVLKQQQILLLHISSQRSRSSFPQLLWLWVWRKSIMTIKIYTNFGWKQPALLWFNRRYLSHNSCPSSSTLPRFLCPPLLLTQKEERLRNQCAVSEIGFCTKTPGRDGMIWWWNSLIYLFPLHLPCEISGIIMDTRITSTQWAKCPLFLPTF